MRLSAGSPFVAFLLTLRRPSSESALKEEGTATTYCSPGRIVVVRTVVGDVEPTSSASVDGVDLPVGPGPTREGYLLAPGRVGGRDVAPSVASEFDPTSTSGVHGVDLGVL